MTDDAVAILSRLGRRGDGRIRVYDAAGVLLADSVRSPDLTASDRAPEEAAVDYASASGIRERVLYRVGAWIVRVRRALLSVGRALLTPSGGSRSSSGSPRSEDAQSDQDAPQGPEVRAALEGRYGTGVRPTPGQRSLTLYSAVPIRHGDRVVGAALVSQSTFRILQALYDVRLRIDRWPFGAAVVINIMSATIVRPLVRLRRAAMAPRSPSDTSQPTRRSPGRSET
jgi:hypothetical protein